MKYLTPRSKLILALVGAWALVVVFRATPTTPPPAAPQITMPSAVPTERPTTRPIFQEPKDARRKDRAVR